MTAVAKRRRSPKADSYHHGDLRRALLDEAASLMRKKGPEALSLRELGRRLGVTPGAPYHHFADKDDLFAAIAEEAFAALLALVQARVLESGATEPAALLRIAARTYLDFAMADRARYRVMFWPQLRDRKRFASLHETGGQALRLLGEAFAGAGVSARAARARAVACWSTLHGFAVLANDDFLDDDAEAELPALTRTIVDTATALASPAR